ncbi:phosphatase 2C-like domain-containing protein [Hyaloraphidium curvatum]|nr:phosphatase 2C-like domain-containing protein [Hyaloraphidium curvatum]
MRRAVPLLVRPSGIASLAAGLPFARPAMTTPRRRVAQIGRHLGAPRSPTSPSARALSSTPSPRAEHRAEDGLSPAVAKLLRKAEVSQGLRDPRHGVAAFHANSVPANDPIEDAYSVQCEPRKGSTRTFFTVADGHMGPDVALVVTRYLPSYLARELGKIEVQEDTKSGSGDAKDGVGPDLEARAEAITRAFMRLDADIVNGGIPAPPNAEIPQGLAQQGACCISAVFDPAQGGIFVAGAGDCRAVLGKRSATGWEMVEMSKDHTLRDEGEMKRLQDEHPGEPPAVLGSGGRVLGVLMPSRAFGDADFKWQPEAQRKLGSIPFPSRIYQSPPYMTADPDVFFFPTPDTPTDKPGPSSFLILATDGLWDFLSSSAAVACVASLIDSPSFPSANPATTLIREAFSGGAGQPASRRARRAEQLLSIPPGPARNYRDDVTVLVVFFAQGGPGWAAEYAADVDAARMGPDDGMVKVDPEGLGGPKEHKISEWTGEASPKSQL